MSVVNIRKKELQKRGYRDLMHWLEDTNNVYIGRNMTFYVHGAKKSKFANPFSAKKYGRQGCIDKYREWIQEQPELMNSLEELRGKTLGCWCKPEACHGDVLLDLLNK